jgi:oligopeptide/dipeptide ABC transporter ATP-binding protein
MAAEPDGKLLSVEDLVVAINGVPVVDGVSFSAGRGEIVALVGESGCGKSLTALAMMGLLPPAATVARGAVRLDSDELISLGAEKLRTLRGNRMSIIFQEPVASLNPLMRAGEQVAESLIIHRGLDHATARIQAREMLTRVGIPDVERRFRQFPFELSGGMCQRIMIASALVCRPRLLIADEPTTALDVTIQAQILELMKDLRRETGTAIMIITHDMGVVADIADRMMVMYAGRIVESGTVDDVFARPSHPYTRLLLATVPRLEGERKMRLRTIEGAVPDVSDWPSGCRFRARCPLADGVCETVPMLEPIDARPSHRSACWHAARVAEVA